MVVALLASTAASSVYAGPVYFVVGERQFEGPRFDSYVLPLTEAADIAHARDLIARGPDAAGEPITFASVVAGADGINRNVVARGDPLWHWHVSQFEGFGDFGIELIDGSPTTVENDVQGWIRNTTRDGPNIGQVGFWNYTVIAELTEPPIAVPLPAGAATGAVGLIALFIVKSRARTAL